MDKVIDALQRWHWLLTLVMAGLLVMGFGFETPQSKFGRLEGRLHEMEQVQPLVNSLAIGECLDRDLRELQLMQMPCERLVPGWPQSREIIRGLRIADSLTR